MANRVPVNTPVATLAKHPAVVAWNRLTGASAVPNRITQLNREVYRLFGMKKERDFDRVAAASTKAGSGLLWLFADGD